MDTAQIILVAAVVVLTAILVLVGYEVFLIFKEFLRTVKKFNQIMDDVTAISGSVSKQVNSLSELLTTARTTFDLAKIFFRKGRHEEIEGKKEEEKPSIGSSVRRFFTRAGKKLS